LQDLGNILIYHKVIEKNNSNDFLGAPPSGNTLSFPTRREFLTTLVGCSGALALGVPSLILADDHPPTLDDQVEKLVKQMRSQGLIRPEEKTSWSVYDFTTDKKLVTINEDIPRQAASMIKPFVAQAYFYALGDSRGKLSYTKKVRKTMEKMICDSDNAATNRLISTVSRYRQNRGARDVEQVLKKKAPGIFRHTRIVESIPANGRTYRNQASAHDYSRFLYALWHSQLPFADELREIMSLPNADRIYRGVPSIPRGTKVYDKTGSTARLCGNMGIIDAPGSKGRRYPYTFIDIIERPSRVKDYGSWLDQRSDAIRAVSDLVYRNMKQRHRLT